MILTKAEALIITNNAKYLKNHKDEANLNLVLKDLDSHIRVAAEHGQYHTVWSTGGALFRDEIENTLEANGFYVIYYEGSYTIKWDPPGGI